MSDLRDFTGKNRRFTGTKGERISIGTTGERVAGQGILRFNSTTNLMEYYSGTDWKAIDAPPVITSISIDDPAQSNVTSGRINAAGGGTVEIQVNGSLFDTTGGTVTCVGSGETLSAASTVRNNANLLTTTFTESQFDTGNAPYTIKVTNGSGLSAELTDVLTVDSVPAFTNAADTNVDIFDSARGSVTIAAADLAGATDSDSDTITYSITAGALPTGLSISSSTAVISGSTSAVGSDTVVTFTVQAGTSFGNNTRQFTITQKAPVVTSITTTGSGTFTATPGSTISYIVVAGGGGGGAGPGDQDTGKGGGGAGGMCVGTFAFPSTLSPTSIPLSVGVGASPVAYGTGVYGNQGTNSVLTLPSVTVTAIGGGGGGTSDDISAGDAGRPGGSGGGSGSRPSGSVGTATQTSGTGYTGYGQNGGQGGASPPDSGGGGGGGAGAVGQNYQGSKGGDGGVGRQSSITGTATYYAGGGGGGNFHNASRSAGGSGGGGRGNQGRQSDFTPDSSGIAATANTGGGGGGAGDGQSSNQPAGIGGAGGSGVIIISY
tara:strand:+ start:119 stop:1759 length:1641 start_codon:yes stop_codon:yes gene_type:complete